LIKSKEVSVGEIAVEQDQDDLVASGIGSCVVITLYDPKHKIGALAHSMLPSSVSRESSGLLRDTIHEIRDTRYIDIAIDQMLKKMQGLGAKKEDIEAKLIGGANMFAVVGPNESTSIGEKNIASAKEKLRRLGVVIVGECVGGSQGRSVEFSLANGIVTVKTKF
jgi:chemotaxis protein CheD